MQRVMIRFRPLLAAATVLAFSLLARTASAESIRTFLDGRELPFDQPPLIENDRTLVPVRLLLESVGADVSWDQESKRVTARMDDMEISAVIGSLTAVVNGQTIVLDAPARLVGNRTLIPLRFFAENLGFAVHWEESQRAIHIGMRGEERSSRDGSSGSRKGLALLLTAQEQVGRSYAWGGTSPETGFDCSGLTLYVAAAQGIQLPRTSQEQYAAGVAVEWDSLAAGDLLFYTTYEAGPSHVGIYDGQGSFVHAQSAETGVKVTPIANPWWSARYIGARRIVR